MRSYSPYYDPNAGVSLGVSGGGGAVGADQAHGPPASGGPAAGEPEVPGTLPDPGVRFSPQQIGSHNRQLNVFYLRPDDDEAHERFMADIGAMVAGGVPGAWPGPALPDVPVPSPQHVPRPDLLDAARNLLAPGTGRGPGMVGLVGMGGVGKTTAARAICDDAAVRARFADGIIWLTVGVGADPVTCQRDLAAVLGDLSPIDDATAGRDKLRGLLSGKSCLIVADDIWAAEVAVALDVGLPDVRLLVTTRDQQALTRDAGTCQLDLADDGTARRILAAWARTTPDQLPPQAEEVISRCGGLPLALAAAGGLAADQVSWSSVLDRLRGADLAALRAGFPDYPAPNLLAAFDAGVTSLPGPARERYLRLAAFEQRGPVPARMAFLLWSGHGGDEAGDIELLAMLARRSLLRLDPARGTFTLHDLQFGYACWAAGGDGVAAAHRVLSRAILDRWGGMTERLPATAGRLFGADPADQYAVVHLVGHLAAADELSMVHQLLAMDATAFAPAGVQPGGNLWFTVHDRLTDAATYLRDVATARALAEADTDSALARGDQPAGIMAEIRYALVAGSVASLANNIPWTLLGPLVEGGLMPAGQALAYARAMPSAHNKFLALARLLPALPANWQREVTQEALTALAADDSGLNDRPDSLQELFPFLTPEQRASVLRDALARTRRRSAVLRASLLLALADAIPEEQREAVLAEALSAAGSGASGGNPLNQAEALTKMAARLPAARRGPLLAHARDAALRWPTDHLRSRQLTDIAELHSGLRRRRVRADALAAARKVESPAWRWVALVEVARLFSGRERQEVLGAAMASLRADPGALRLASSLPAELLPELLPVARSINDPQERCHALLKIAPDLPLAGREQVLADALAAARQIPDEDGGRSRGLALEDIAAKLPAERRGDLLRAAFTACRAIGDQRSLVELRAAIGSRLPAPDGLRVLRQLAEAAQAVRDPERQVPRLQEVARWAPASLRVGLLSQALDIIASDVRAHRIGLSSIARDIPAALAGRALDLAEQLGADEPFETWYPRTCMGLADWIADESLDVVAIAMALDPTGQDFLAAQTRRALARMTGDQLAEGLRFAAELYNERGIANYQAKIAGYLPETARRQAQTEVLEFAHAVHDPKERADLLIPLAAGLLGDQRAAVVRDALAAVRRIDDPRDRARPLAEVAALTDGEDQAGLFLEALADAALDTGVSGGSGLMKSVAARAAECGAADWPRFWRPVLRQAALEGRWQVADLLCGAFTEIVRMAGPAAPAAMLAALDDVIRWWP